VAKLLAPQLRGLLEGLEFPGIEELERATTRWRSFGSIASAAHGAPRAEDGMQKPALRACQVSTAVPVLTGPLGGRLSEVQLGQRRSQIIGRCPPTTIALRPDESRSSISALRELGVPGRREARVQRQK